MEQLNSAKILYNFQSVLDKKEMSLSTEQSLASSSSEEYFQQGHHDLTLGTGRKKCLGGMWHRWESGGHRLAARQNQQAIKGKEECDDQTSMWEMVPQLQQQGETGQ